MVVESLTFSSCDLPSSDFSSSRSSPAQNALPVPVTMRTCASERSTSSSADRNSEISWKLTALRFSGRLKVMRATAPAVSSSSVL
jgi:hypothetical protein